MEVFGEKWFNYQERIRDNWCRAVSQEDLVLIAGDISWAMDLEHALVDLEWIHALPGTKLILRGNHDYWWPSFSKLKQFLPPSIHFIQNNAFSWGDISFAGSRLWDTQEYSFGSISAYSIDEKTLASKMKDEDECRADEKIFQRELQRLEISLQALDQKARLRVALTHYPPIGLDLKSSRAAELLEKYRVDICIFGHLHGLRGDVGPLFGKRGSVCYVLTSSDYLQFFPIKIIT